MEWADESDRPIGLSSRSGEWVDTETALNQSMSSARWIQVYLEWLYEESSNVLHVGFRNRSKFDRRTAIQPFCSFVRRASDRQITFVEGWSLSGQSLQWQYDESLAA
jgi:hypothetical protein